jgi:hypothetical protein
MVRSKLDLIYLIYLVLRSLERWRGIVARFQGLLGEIFISELVDNPVELIETDSGIQGTRADVGKLDD